MPPGITIVGLGPGGPELWTEAARNALGSAPEIWLRTARHPGVEKLRESGKARVHSLDAWYEEASDFDSLYARIADHIVKLGAREQGVVYAVPGSPMVGEATVARICVQAGDAGLTVTLVPGLSFIEPTLAVLGIDALDGLQIADADQLAAMHHPPLEPDRPALVAQLYNRRQAAQVKLTLMNAYPDQHPVTLVRAAGTDKEQVLTCPLYELDRQPGIDHLTTLYLPPLPRASGLSAFQETVAHLRAPDGCPWDREQTHQSLRPYLLEECHEVLAALDAGDPEALLEELGDLLLQIVLHAQIAAEMGDFQMADIIGTIDAKIRRRHPHVFGDVQVNGVQEVLDNWEAIKQAERAASGAEDWLNRDEAGSASALDGVPLAMPALARAQTISRKAVRVGFEWPNLDGVLEKLTEEAREVADAATPEEREAEIGDLLFVIVNLARWLDVDAESALRATNERFILRFRTLERLARELGQRLADLDIKQLDGLWEEAKHILPENKENKLVD
ncbi:MAG: nucleoside triphosphate pyrophosphohydrolase [Anaerolineae bacterium]